MGQAQQLYGKSILKEFHKSLLSSLQVNHNQQSLQARLKDAYITHKHEHEAWTNHCIAQHMCIFQCILQEMEQPNTIGNVS